MILYISITTLLVITIITKLIKNKLLRLKLSLLFSFILVLAYTLTLYEITVFSSQYYGGINAILIFYTAILPIIILNEYLSNSLTKSKTFLGILAKCLWFAGIWLLFATGLVPLIKEIVALVTDKIFVQIAIFTLIFYLFISFRYIQVYIFKPSK